MFKTFRSAVIAGFTIGLAGFGYLSMIGVLNGVVGAVVFAFGLLTIVAYQLKLFTGTAGFISMKKEDFGNLLLILVGNVIGCGIVALMTRLSPNDINCVAERILTGRVANGALKSGVLAIGCGFIMTTAVTFARKGNVLPLIFGVPLVPIENKIFVIGVYLVMNVGFIAYDMFITVMMRMYLFKLRSRIKNLLK